MEKAKTKGPNMTRIFTMTTPKPNMIICTIPTSSAARACKSIAAKLAGFNIWEICFNVDALSSILLP